MILPDQIIKSSRKTLSLTIKKDGEIIIHAPTRMKDEHISKFVEQKQDWLASKLALIKNNQNKYSDIITYKNYLLFGERYSVSFADIKKVEILNRTILLPKKIEQSKIVQTLEAFYKKKAKEILFKRLGYLQDILKIKCNSFKISNSKGRWGSCNSSGAINLNWRVVMLPPNCIDYVLIHELCHLVEMNHSKRFWSLVETFLPNYDMLRTSLKEYSFLLDLYREK